MRDMVQTTILFYSIIGIINSNNNMNYNNSLVTKAPSTEKDQESAMQ